MVTARSSSEAPRRVVIAGGGQAGLAVAFRLRELGFGGAVAVVAAERGRPYQRPPLSKALLAGTVGADALATHDGDDFAAGGIELIDGTAVLAIDRRARNVRLSNGAGLRYDDLVLATGARNRTLACEGCELPGIYHLRTMEEALAMRGALAGARAIIVVGAGFLGMEVASCFAAQGKRVTVVEAASRSMARAVTGPVSAAFERRHATEGVSFLFNDQVRAFLGSGAVGGVLTRAGLRLDADAVVVAVGVLPNVELAAEAGLPVANGILVDERLRTPDPAIWAIGDCASFPDGGGARWRIESVQNAVDQGRYVADRIMGSGGSYEQVPLFWSEQLGLRLQIAGVPGGDDGIVVRGDAAGGSFSVFRTRGDRVTAVESVNDPRTYMLGRRMLGQRSSVPAGLLAATDVDLKSLIGQAGGADEAAGRMQ